MYEELIKEYGGIEVSAMEVYTDIFKLGEGYIQRENEEGGSYKANPIMYYKKNGESKGNYRILFEDTFEEVLKEGQEADFCIVNGISYFGRKNVQAYASKMYAMIFDLDGINTSFLKNFLHGCFVEWADRDTLYPLPNYMVLSGHNVHLYYVFEEPIALYPNIKLQLKELKYALTSLLWNRYTSMIEKPQYQGINQGFRPIGGKTKVLDKRVKAFQLNTHPYTLQAFNDYVPKESKIDDRKLFKESKYTLEQAKQKFPKWYEKVVLKKENAVKKWDIKGKVNGANPYALYDWWLNQIKTKVTFGHRYFCIMILTIYAVKNDVEFDKLRQDAYSLIPIFNDISDEPFTKQDVDSALECYDDRYCTFPLKDIEKLSAIPIERNKRNYQKQANHLEIARAIQLIKDRQQGTNWRDGNGRPTKEKIVREYLKEHREATKAEVIRETGLSKPTVYKYYESIQKEFLNIQKEINKLNKEKAYWDNKLRVILEKPDQNDPYVQNDRKTVRHTIWEFDMKIKRLERQLEKEIED